jgi:hypothetical protein
MNARNKFGFSVFCGIVFNYITFIKINTSIRFKKCLH